jgi:lysophospholipase L1-like esterase
MVPRRFANAVLVAAALTAASGAALSARDGDRNDARTLRGLLPIAAPAVLGAGFLAALGLPVNVRIKVALVSLSLAVAASVAEVYLKDFPGRRARWLASRLGVPYDPRTQLEVVRDLRRRGVDAWPSVVPAVMDSRAGSDIAPLGGISGVTAVVCNEIGNYLIYQSDARGFNNPPELWSGGPLDIAVLGDSYTEGRCVPSDQNMVALIRRRYPATLNLGVAGNGPLRELAGLREYLPALKPRRILWCYFEGNDLTYDMDREYDDPVLARYLDPGFSQGLAFRQPEIDTLLRRRLEKIYREMEAEPRSRKFLERWRDVLLLRSLRASLGLAVRKPSFDVQNLNYDLFRRILAEARKTADTWGGRVYFVYLPIPKRFEISDLRRANDEVRMKIFAMLGELDISSIDLVDVFGNQPNLTELYTPVGGHFTPAGYALAADSVLRALEPTSPGGVP